MDIAAIDRRRRLLDFQFFHCLPPKLRALLYSNICWLWVPLRLTTSKCKTIAAFRFCMLLREISMQKFRGYDGLAPPFSSPNNWH
jgi:hypothetical protein